MAAAAPSEPLPLVTTFHVSCMRRDSAPASAESYAASIQPVFTFSTLQDFVAHYAHLHRPADLPAGTDLFLFRDGVRPMWEDPANENGGCMKMRLKKGSSGRVWEDLVLWVVGNQMRERREDEGAVCGIALSVKSHGDVVSIWTRTCEDAEVVAIRESAKKCVRYAHRDFEFKPHMREASGGPADVGQR